MKQYTKFVPYRRKRSGKTNYRKRLKLLVSGTPRMVVRKTNTNMIVQIIEYSEKGDHVIVTASSTHLKKNGWKHATGNLPAAYLIGMIAGKTALAKKFNKAIIDIGLQTPSKGSRLYAAVKGAIDAGMDIACSKEAFPSEDRIKGKHISDYRKQKNIPSDLDKAFEDMKAKLMK